MAQIERELDIDAYEHNGADPQWDGLVADHTEGEWKFISIDGFTMEAVKRGDFAVVEVRRDVDGRYILHGDTMMREELAVVFGPKLSAICWNISKEGKKAKEAIDTEEWPWDEAKDVSDHFDDLEGGGDRC